jgi:hypothetical protein
MAGDSAHCGAVSTHRVHTRLVLGVMFTWLVLVAHEWRTFLCAAPTRQLPTHLGNGDTRQPVVFICDYESHFELLDVTEVSSLTGKQ